MSRLFLLLLVRPLQICQAGMDRADVQRIIDDVYSDSALSAHGTEGGLYGETGVEAIADSIAAMRPSSGEVFVDLGSGNGKVNLAASLLFNFKRSVGYESSPTRHEQACRVLDMLRGNNTTPGKMPKSFRGSMQFIKGDFTEASWRDADIIFGGLLPDEKLMKILSDKFRLMKNGARILMLRQISDEFLHGIEDKGSDQHSLGWSKSHPIYKYERKDGQLSPIELAEKEKKKEKEKKEKQEAEEKKQEEAEEKKKKEAEKKEAEKEKKQKEAEQKKEKEDKIKEEKEEKEKKEKEKKKVVDEEKKAKAEAEKEAKKKEEEEKKLAEEKNKAEKGEKKKEEKKSKGETVAASLSSSTFDLSDLIKELRGNSTAFLQQWEGLDAVAATDESPHLRMQKLTTLGQRSVFVYEKIGAADANADIPHSNTLLDAKELEMSHSEECKATWWF